MKRIVFVFVFLFSLKGFSQVEKGKHMIGGYLNISLSSETIETTAGTGTIKTKNPSKFEFSIQPYFGGMVADNTAIGIRFDFDYSREVDFDYFGLTNGGGDNIIKQQLFFVSPFARYYKSLGEKLFMFTEPVVHFGTGTLKQKRLENFYQVVDDEPIKEWVLSPQLGLGFNYFISEKYALELYWAGMYYRYMITKQTYPDNYQGFDVDVKQIDKSFNLNFNFDALYIGMNIYF